MNSFQIVYSLSYNYKHEVFAFLIPFVMAIIFAALALLRKNKKMEKVSFGVISAVLFLVFTFVFLGSLLSYNHAKKVLDNGEYNEVIGIVEDYNAGAKHARNKAEGTDKFYVDSVRFEISDRTSVGYNVIGANGGCINRNGMVVKIRYYTNNNGENIILEISIPTD